MAGVATAAVMAGCGSAQPAAAPGTVTVTKQAAPVTVTVTASASSASSSAVSSTATTSSVAAAPAGPLLAGDLAVEFPAGDPGKISVVAQGPRQSGGYGTSWPIVIRNNSGRQVCDIKATMSATSGGQIVGSHSLDSVTPGIVDDGGIAFSSAYFSTAIPDDATVEFIFTSKTSNCYGASAYIDEVNTVPGAGGDELVGKIRAGNKKIGGPISIDILCMDGKGQPLSGGANSGFADQDSLDAGQSGTFSVDPGSGPCDQFLVGASGYAF